MDGVTDTPIPKIQTPRSLGLAKRMQIIRHVKNELNRTSMERAEANVHASNEEQLLVDR